MRFYGLLRISVYEANCGDYRWRYSDYLCRAPTIHNVIADASCRYRPEARHVMINGVRDDASGGKRATLETALLEGERSQFQMFSSALAAP